MRLIRIYIRVLSLLGTSARLAARHPALRPLTS
jgi:hypothetical protein